MCHSSVACRLLLCRAYFSLKIRTNFSKFVTPWQAIMGLDQGKWVDKRRLSQVRVCLYSMQGGNFRFKGRKKDRWGGGWMSEWFNEKMWRREGKLKDFLSRGSRAESISGWVELKEEAKDGEPWLCGRDGQLWKRRMKAGWRKQGRKGAEAEPAGERGC